jgi:UDP-N-acetyl-D-mannosaminuronate dehydrogenase
VHDPLVSSDPNLSDQNNVFLTSDLKKAVRNSNLIILATDHQQYKKLDKIFFGNIPVYDGRGILDRNLAKVIKLLTIGQGKNNL